MKNAAIYLLRFLLSVVVYVSLSIILLKHSHSVVHLFGQRYLGYVIALLSQLDVYHHLVYAGLALTVAVMLLTWWNGLADETKPLRPRLVISAVTAMALGAIPAAAAGLARAEAWSTPYIIGSVYVALNVFFFFVAAMLIARNPTWGRRIRQAVLLADVLAPLAVWAAFCEREPKLLRRLQILPLFLMVAAVFLPWIIWPVAGVIPPLPREIRLLSRGLPFYQVTVDPANGEIITSDQDHFFLKIDPISGKLVHYAVIEPHHEKVQGFGVDHDAREIMFFDPCTGRTSVFDETDLHLKRSTAIADYQQCRPEYCESNSYLCRVVWDAAQGITLVIASLIPPYLVGPAEHPAAADVRAISVPEGLETLDAALDVANRRLHWVTSRLTLWRFDIDQGRVTHSLALPSMPGRIALDAKRNRLFVTLPIEGRILVLDATSYQLQKTITSVPGVRVITVDSEQDRLFLGGFTPLLEIRSLNDFSLQDRLTAPPWMHWIDVDNRRERAYWTANPDGNNAAIWALDLAKLRQDKWGAFWRRIDPVYPLTSTAASWIGPLVMRLAK